MNLMQIDKLDDSNYATWSVQMRSVLVHADLWAVTCRRETKPEETATAQVAAFVSKEEKALASILLCVKPTQLNHLKVCKTAAEAWDKLKEVHQPKGPARKIMLFKKLLQTKLFEGGHIVEHVDEFVTAVESLAEVDFILPDEMLTILLLSSLPKSYENFVVAIETRDSLPSFHSLKVKLLEEGARQHETEKATCNGGTVETLLQTQASSKFQRRGNNNMNKSNGQHFNENKNSRQHYKKSKSNGQNNNRKCYNCGEPGHFAAKCNKPKRNENNACFMTTLLTMDNINGNNLKSSDWCVDSGATSHFCCVREWFNNYEKYNETIILPNNMCAKAIGRGDVDIRGTNITLKQVLHVLEISNNFISVSKATSAGMSVIFKNNFVEIKDKNKKCVLKAYERDGLFVYKENKDEKCYRVANLDEKVIKWHNRFGHINYNCLRDMINKNTVRGIKIKCIPNSLDCVTCAKSKISVKPFQPSQNRSNETLQLIHSDVCGPVNKNSFGGCRFFVTFIDDYTRYITVYFLKSKDEVFKAFCEYKNYVEKLTGKNIKCIRSDNGGEYVNGNFDKYLREHGIRRQLTVPHTPQQNGVAERCNRTLVEMARAMLVHSGLSENFWAEAVRTAAYIRNRTITKSLFDKTPFEMWNGFKPDVSHLKIFGAKAIALDKTVSRKFAPKGIESIMIGYSEDSKAYRLYIPNSRKVMVARDVIFFEDKLDELEASQNDDIFIFNTNVYDKIEEPLEKDNVQTGEEEDVDVKDLEHTEQQRIQAEGVGLEKNEHIEVKYGPGRPRIIRDGSRGRPKKVLHELNTINKCQVDVPENAEHALSGPYASEWLKSMTVEYESLLKNDTWELADLPHGQVAIGCKWVYAVKRNKEGDIQKLKSRLVAKGCNQRYGINYHETFSPVVRYANIRLVIALAVEHNIYLHQMDVSSAYLNGNLHDDVFMKQIPYFEDKKFPNKVLKLKKSLYGLKQSGREWNFRLDDVLKKLGFSACVSDPCIYIKQQNKIYNIIVVYVDDLIVGSSSLPELENIKKLIASEFEVIDGGELSYFLGMEFDRKGDLGEISISQRQYILDVLEKYRMLDCKEVSTPLVPGYQVNCKNENCRKVDKTEYQSAIGILMYLALSTRPDILLSVTKLAQRNCNPHSEHEAAYKHIMRYLRKTADYKLHYRKTGRPIECHVDADWAGDPTDRKSFSGYVFVAANCVFSWSARKQNVVSLSTTEAEYIAISTAATEVIYIKKLLAELNFPHDGPMIIYNDNQSAQCLVKNPTYHCRSKHISIKYHHIRDLYSRNEIKMAYIPTDDMMSDILTKNASKIKHHKFTNCMGLH